MQIFLLSEDISHELRFLMHAFILGTVITFLYDNIRIFRRVIRHHDIIVSLEDLLFWIVVSISVFTLQFYENNGVFRWFSIFGAFFGMLCYRFLFSKIYVNCMTKVWKWLLHYIYKFLCFVTAPIFYLEKSTRSNTGYILRRCLRIGKVAKIRLTAKIKLSKLLLCKQKEKQREKSAGRKGRHEQKD